MGLRKKASLIIYRFAEKGLEVFLQSTKNELNDTEWHLPESDIDRPDMDPIQSDRMIELDPVAQDNGNVNRAWAVEGEWHDIPTFCNMMVNDMREVKEKIIKKIPVPEAGSFINVKDAFKKVLPHQYELIKELKDILIDRNSTKNI